ncbi:MAG: hypothetical protein HP494_11140 [Nitrospira sp.]|nr:hypothetical protein [Nitrospira sp.]
MARAMADKTHTGHHANPADSSAVTNHSICTRCGGLMVNEFFMEALDGIGESNFHPKRCVQCGEVVDFVILINRQQEQQPMPTQLVKEMSSHNRMTKGQ